MGPLTGSAVGESGGKSALSEKKLDKIFPGGYCTCTNTLILHRLLHKQRYTSGDYFLGNLLIHPI
jgi:hypothetical protein